MKELNIITYNVNGIRAAVKNGFLDWLKPKNIDIICIQEIKVAYEDFDHRKRATAVWRFSLR
jgi:exodeoxyribonuclease-3